MVTSTGQVMQVMQVMYVGDVGRYGYLHSLMMWALAGDVDGAGDVDDAGDVCRRGQVWLSSQPLTDPSPPASTPLICTQMYPLWPGATFNTKVPAGQLPAE